MFDLYASASTRKCRAPVPKLIPRICILFPISTIALNPPLLKLYNCANFALNDINEFAKGQGYAVSKFRLKTNAVAVGMGAGEPVEAAYRPQVEMVVAKLVRILPHKLPSNPIN